MIFSIATCHLTHVTKKCRIKYIKNNGFHHYHATTTTDVLQAVLQ